MLIDHHSLSLLVLHVLRDTGFQRVFRQRLFVLLLFNSILSKGNKEREFVDADVQYCDAQFQTNWEVDNQLLSASRTSDTNEQRISAVVSLYENLNEK